MHCFNIKLPFFIVFLVLLQCLWCLASPSKTSDNPTLEIPSYVAGRTVDSIVVDNRNIFDPDDPKFQHFIFRLANKLHYKTRKETIRQEMLFNVEKPFSIELAEETERNLRNNLQLYDAWIKTDTLSNGHLLVRVVTIDEWSLAMEPNYSFEDNENRFELTVSDRNLFGRNKFLSLGYTFQNYDGDFFRSQYTDPRLFGRSIGFETKYSDNPAGRLKMLTVYRPFYNLKQKTTWNISWLSNKNRQDIYNNSTLIGRSESKIENIALEFGSRFGSYRHKFMFDGEYTYKDKGALDTVMFNDNQSDCKWVAVEMPHDSIFHTIGVGATMAHLDFAKLRQIDGIRYTEDFTLGQKVALSISRAFQPGFHDYVWDKMEMQIAQGYQFGHNLAYISLSRNMWIQSGGDLRRLTNLTLYYYSFPLDFVTFACHGNYLSDWRSNSADGVSLGGINGIRGYDKHFKTGDRKAVFNAEFRFFPKIDILSAMFSPTVFVDGGRTWKSESKLNWKDFYFSGGIGLRAGIGHSSRNRIARIDIAYSEYNGWQFSVGIKQYFEVRETSLLLTTH